MVAYYNEIEPFAAQWLRNLIEAGHIAPGDVDERSIVDIRPSELAGYTQCHFFAGIGVWSYALRLAGWPDERPVWTGSCPCQPFSAAGKGGGFDDERHLWPAFHHLIRECRPPVVLGEQVASKDGLAWLDLVQADLEGTGYASAAVDLCAAGVGAPHIRQRLWWVGERLADADQQQWNGRGDAGPRWRGEPTDDGGSGRLADAECVGRERREGVSAGREHDRKNAGWVEGDDGPVSVGQTGDGPRRPRPADGFWRDADWLFCRDGKWRPVEPGTFPLAHGAPARVGRLRAYGNAIVAQAAATFIGAYLDMRAA